MADSKLTIILGALLVPMLYLIYHDLLLFTVDSEEIRVEKAIQDAISKSGYEDLELRRISEYQCPRDWRQKDKKVRVLHCSASALFTDGTSSEVSIEKKEYVEKFYRGNKERSQVWRKDFTVTIPDLGPDFQGESSISKIIRLGS